jgi:hypothetical protein
MLQINWYMHHDVYDVYDVYDVFDVFDVFDVLDILYKNWLSMYSTI